jgi:organic radical activating enzyme
MTVNARTEKFTDPFITADGKQRAQVRLKKLETLWFNTGTLCNISCHNCYIESTPTNDRLTYLSISDIRQYLDEIDKENLDTEEIGITGGEPFMNPDIIPIMKEILDRGYRLLLLTNAMRPMMRPKCRDALLELKQKHNDFLTIRISIDHFDPNRHEEERGAGSWGPMIKGLKFLSDNNFNIDIAGRTLWGESEEELRKGYSELFKKHKIDINAANKKQLLLFPEMDEKAEVPEITTDCWDILGISPDDMMCAKSRMVVKHKGEDKAVVQACTLLAYDRNFTTGDTLKEALDTVSLNHPHCAKFCVLGGGSCSVND